MAPNLSLITTVAVAVACLSSAPLILAWGDKLAHPATGELAQMHLTDNGKQLVQNLLDPSFSGSLGGQSEFVVCGQAGGFVLESIGMY